MPMASVNTGVSDSPGDRDDVRWTLCLSRVGETIREMCVCVLVGGRGVIIEIGKVLARGGAHRMNQSTKAYL